MYPSSGCPDDRPAPQKDTDRKAFVTDPKPSIPISGRSASDVDLWTESSKTGDDPCLGGCRICIGGMPFAGAGLAGSAGRSAATSREAMYPE